MKNILKFRFGKIIILLHEYGVINKLLAKFDSGFNRYIIKRIINLKSNLICDYDIWIKIIDTLTGRLISENPYNSRHIKEILWKITKIEYNIENQNHFNYLLSKSHILGLIQNINNPNPIKSLSILNVLNTFLSCLIKIKSSELNNTLSLQPIDESLSCYSNNIDLFLDILFNKLCSIHNDGSIKTLGVKNFIVMEIIGKLIRLNYENVAERVLERNYFRLVINFIQYFELNTFLHELTEKIFFDLTVSGSKELRNLLWNENFCEFLIKDMVGKPYSPFLARFIEGSIKVLGEGINNICDESSWKQIFEMYEKQTEIQTGAYKQCETKNTKEDVIKKKLMNFLKGSKLSIK